MIEPGPGILLIADPFLKDPNFLRTVVFLCEHKEEGSFGFVLNRMFENTLDELVPELEGYKIPVYYGGPVQLNSVHFLHQYPELIPGGQEVLKGIFWGGDFDLVIELIKEGSIDLKKIRFYIGYSGWGEGQLSGEIKEKTWLTVKATKRLIFHPRHKETWKDSLLQLGGEYEQIINYPIDPQLN
ncbi:MAG TPA: YqgE/AlgH family protein [Chitinophagaceae bacterium]|jgi:putative transcriptional regulator|nr:YqgE/AlgH family protein [Chitinophagaceae bacterium]